MNHSIYLRLSAFVVSSLILGMAMTGCGGSGASEENSTGEAKDSVQMQGVTVDPGIFPPEAKISSLTYEDVKYNKDADNYSFEAKATLANVTTKPQIKYTLEYSLEKNYVLTSDNGKFEGVKPLKEGSFYILKAECEGLESVQTGIPSEAMPEIPKISKTTAKDIEAKLNDKSQPLLGKSEIINPDCVYEFQNKKEPYEITSLSLLYEKLAFDWEDGVEVISLGYDEFNRVNKIVMKINYSD